LPESRDPNERFRQRRVKARKHRYWLRRAVALGALIVAAALVALGATVVAGHGSSSDGTEAKTVKVAGQTKVAVEGGSVTIDGKQLVRISCNGRVLLG
jgi:cell division septal protein FtsQ